MADERPSRPMASLRSAFLCCRSQIVLIDQQPSSRQPGKVARFTPRRLRVGTRPHDCATVALGVAASAARWTPACRHQAAPLCRKDHRCPIQPWAKWDQHSAQIALKSIFNCLSIGASMRQARREQLSAEPPEPTKLGAKAKRIELLESLLREGAKQMPLAQSDTRRNWFIDVCKALNIEPYK